MTRCTADIDTDGKELDFVYFHCPISKGPLFSLMDFNNTGTGTARANNFFAVEY